MKDLLLSIGCILAGMLLIGLGAIPLVGILTIPLGLWIGGTGVQGLISYFHRNDEDYDDVEPGYYDGR